MLGRMRPRRSLWLGLSLGVVISAAVAAGAIASQGPANLGFTPQSERQMQNIDVGRAWAKNYYGAPTASSGSGGSWDAPLNQTSNYANEARSVAAKGVNWLKKNRHVAPRALALAGNAPPRRHPGDRARRRRHDADHVELRALQQLGLQPDHERPVRRPDGQHVHR